MSRSLAAPFIVEKDLTAGARPFCSFVFHFGGAVGDVYVSDRDVTIDGDAHIGAAADIGEYHSSITPRDGAFAVKSMALRLINFPIFSGATKRFTDLWQGLGPEGIECDVYQNLKDDGGTIHQEPLFKAVMRPVEYDPHEATIELISISEKYLEKKEVSFAINNTDFANADLDDIGKRANIGIGSFKKAVAHAVVAGPSSTLRQTIGTGDTTIPIHNEFYDAVPTAGTVQIGNEKITYTGKGGSADSRTLTGAGRAALGSPLESHLKDDTILQVLTEYVYMAAGKPLKAISRVYIKRDQKEIPLAPSQYTVELNNSMLVAGKNLSLIKFSAPPLIAAKDFVSINDGIGVSDTIGVSQANNESQWNQAGSDQVEIFNFTGGSQTFNRSLSFPAQQKSHSTASFIKRVSWSKNPAGTSVNYSINGVALVGGSGTLQIVDTLYWNFTLTGQVSAPGLVATDTISLSAKTISYPISATVTKTGAASKVGTVTLSNQSTADLVIGDAVLFDGEGCADDGSGTYTGTPGALIEKPADALHFMARELIGIPPSLIDDASFVQARTDSPSSYKFGFIVSERTAAKELLLAAGIQSRIRIDWPVDKIRAQFLKSSYGAVTKTLSQENIISSGPSRGKAGHRKTTLRLRRGEANDILNSVSVYYARQWNKGRGRDAFAKVTQKATNAPSVTKYGEREQADRFLFDFIPAAQSAMAEDLRDFYVSYYAESPRVLSAVVKLDQFELLPGDLIGVSYYTRPPTGAGAFPYTFPITFGEAGEQFDGLNGSQKFLLEEVRIKPGNAQASRPTGMWISGREVA